MSYSDFFFHSYVQPSNHGLQSQASAVAGIYTAAAAAGAATSPWSHPQVQPPTGHPGPFHVNVIMNSNVIHNFGHPAYYQPQ